MGATFWSVSRVEYGEKNEKNYLYFIRAGNLPNFLFVSLVTIALVVTVGFKQKRKSLNEHTLVYF